MSCYACSCLRQGTQRRRLTQQLELRISDPAMFMMGPDEMLNHLRHHEGFSFTEAEAKRAKEAKKRYKKCVRLYSCPHDSNPQQRVLSCASVSVCECKSERELVCACCRAHQATLVPSELRGSVGGMAHFFNSISRDSLISEGRFGPHATYSLCEPKLDDGNICAALATENTLLNAYRQVCAYRQCLNAQLVYPFVSSVAVSYWVGG